MKVIKYSGKHRNPPAKYNTDIQNILKPVLLKIDEYIKSGDRESAGRLFQTLPLEYRAEKHIRLIKPSTDNYSFSRALSYRSMCANYASRMSNSHSFPEWRLNEKLVSMQYAKYIGLNVPEVFQAKTELEDIKIEPGTIIKPSFGGGAKGVYAVLSLTEFHEIATGDIVEKETMLSRLSALKSVKKNVTFQVEERVNGICQDAPVDVKFYCFFGQVHLSSTISRNPEVRDYFLRDNRQIKTGRFDELSSVSEGPSEEEYRVAEKTSETIPTPFVRIDFIRSMDGKVYFGEFTPRPGNFDRQNQEIDYFLGECFVDSETRLMNHLVVGKGFDLYRKFWNLQE